MLVRALLRALRQGKLSLEARLRLERIVDELIGFTLFEPLEGTWDAWKSVGYDDRMFVIDNAWDSPADPRLPPERRAAGDMSHSVAVINACKPYLWRDQFPQTNVHSAADRADVAARWAGLLGEIQEAVSRRERGAALVGSGR